MKKFIKLFFTVLLFFVSFSTAFAGDLDCADLSSPLISQKQTEISVKPVDNEKFIVSTNNNNVSEIFASQKRSSDITSYSGDLTSQNISFKVFYNSIYNKNNILKSHLVTSFLSNEICTRAP